MDSLVSTDWLAERLGEPDLVVLDCSVYLEEGAAGFTGVSGRAEFEEGHIPTAGFADLGGELSAPDGPYEYSLPSPESFCAAMGKLGVGDDSRVVLYDGYMSVWAARVWWMLRWIGFERAAVLDGGLPAWMAEERPLSTDPPSHPVRQLTPAPRPRLIAETAEVLAAVSDPGVAVVDTLPIEHYRGDWSFYGRPGHIPGAANLSVLELFGDLGRFRPLGDLAALYDGDRDERTITYCGGGIAASAGAFVLTRLGYEDVAVYAGSLEEWTADPARPLETGDPRAAA